MPYAFLSYSRKQLHYAESVATRVSVWFDLTALTPGTDWRTKIQEGLENSRGTVLIASKTSLASKYVELEWQHAIDHNKPVWVILFEHCDLPDHLADYATAIIDGSRDFDTAIQRLQDSIYRNINHKDEMPAVGLLGLPSRPTWAVRLVSMSLLLNAIYIIGLWSLLALSVTVPERGIWRAWQLIFIVFTVGQFILIVWYLFWKRRINASTLTWTRRILLVLNWFSIFVAGFAVDPEFSRYASVVIFAGVAAIIPLTFLNFTPTMGKDQSRQSADLIRWLPTGSVKRELRQIQNEVSRPTTPDQPKRRPANCATFHITAHRRDRGVAARIRYDLENDFHSYVENDAQFELVLVSRHTDTQAVNAVVQRDTQIIPVIVGNNPSKAVRDILGDRQFVDFRGRESQMIDVISGALRGRRLAQFDMDPISTRRQIIASFETRLLPIH